MKNWILIISLVFVCSACFIKNATLTTRPQLNVSPWHERTSYSDKSKTQYKYMFLKGSNQTTPNQATPNILLIHGGIFDNRVWLYTDKLSQKFNVYALQYPDNSSFYTGNVKNWGQVITDFTESIDIKPDYIAAVSNGAYGAIEYLLNDKNHQVKGLVLISTVMFSVSKEEIKKRTRMAKFALRFSPEKLLGIIESRATKKKYPPADGKISMKNILFIRPYSYYYQLFSVPKTQGKNSQNTQSISIPVLILHGTEDDVMPFYGAKLTLNVFSNATLIEFKGAGHSMVFSHGEQIAQKILDFF